MQSCLENLGLARNPFAAESGVVIATAPLRAAVERVRADLAVGAVVIHVVGARGIGKTSLARVLPKALRGTPILAGIALVRDPRVPWLEIRDAITDQLLLPGEVLSAASLSAACSGGRRLALVVDRADEGSEEFYEHLERLVAQRAGDDAPFFQCVLLSRSEAPADSSLETWLAGRRSAEIEIDRLSPHGVQGYVKQQLLHAGRDEASLFTSDACLAIHRACHGVPARVNEICGRALEAANGRRFTELGAEFVEQIVAARQRVAAVVAEVEAAPAVPNSGKLVQAIRDAAERRAAQTRIEVAESIGDCAAIPCQPASNTVASAEAPMAPTGGEADAKAKSSTTGNGSLAPWVGGVVALAALVSLALR